MGWRGRRNDLRLKILVYSIRGMQFIDFKNPEQIKSAIRRYQWDIDTMNRTITMHQAEIEKHAGDEAEIKKHEEYINEYLIPSLENLKERVGFLEGKLAALEMKGGRKRKSQRNRKSKRRVLKTRKH